MTLREAFKVAVQFLYSPIVAIWAMIVGVLFGGIYAGYVTSFYGWWGLLAWAVWLVLLLTVITLTAWILNNVEGPFNWKMDR